MSTDARSRLVAVAARLLAEGGPDAVSVRKVAAEMGTSTMAVYTYFGSKPELLRAVTVEGFRHLAERLAEVDQTDDTVADLFAAAVAYRRAALDDPNLFAAMFSRPVPEVLTTDDELELALATFQTLVGLVQRTIDAGRVKPAPVDDLALELWAAVHGVCTIELGAGATSATPIPSLLASLCRHLVVGLGDHPSRAERSIPGPA